MFIEGNHGEGLRSPGNRIVELCDRGSGKGEPPARLRLVRREPTVGALHILHLLDSLSSLNLSTYYIGLPSRIEWMPSGSSMSRALSTPSTRRASSMSRTVSARRAIPPQ